MPGPNEKVTALRQAVAAGGPATNAAMTFACLGGHATLLTGVGTHPLAHGMRADLAQAGVRLIDAAEADDTAPAVSSIIVTQGTGDRSVVSMNATDTLLPPPPSLDRLVDEAWCVLIDGHHPALALAAARAARTRGRPCILDGGSWKGNSADLLPYVDIAVCSADFRPPGVTSTAGVLDFLVDSGTSWVAITDGAAPITWAGGGKRGEIPVPAADLVDTLGAGDVFHGALAYALAGAVTADAHSFSLALQFAAVVASYSCQTFGTRTWMEGWVECRTPSLCWAREPDRSALRPR